jgi:rubrerythrin
MNGVQIETVERSADYVAFAAAGEARVGEYHCSECGYGVIVHRLLPRCPMCGGTSWEASPRRPYGL